jgi:hypothetical protein
MIRDEIEDKFNYKGDPKQKKITIKKIRMKFDLKIKRQDLFHFGENACKNQG